MSTDPTPTEQVRPFNAASAHAESGGTPAEAASATTVDASDNATPGAQSDPENMDASSRPVDSERSDAEVMEVDPESVPPPKPQSSHSPPPPRSIRLKVAKDSLSPPIGVTAQLPAAIWPPKTVADVMTRKIITVGENEPIGNLEDLMQKFRFRHLPVVEVGMKLVGLITRTDLLHAELGRMPDGTPAPKIDGATLAGVIMNKNVVFAQLDTPIATACRVMIDQKLTSIPIVLEDHTLVGIVTESDFVRLACELLTARS